MLPRELFITLLLAIKLLRLLLILISSSLPGELAELRCNSEVWTQVSHLEYRKTVDATHCHGSRRRQQAGSQAKRVSAWQTVGITHPSRHNGKHKQDFLLRYGGM